MGKKVVLGVIVIIGGLIAFGIWGGVWLMSRFQPANPSGASPYTAVYLTTGDIYFGKFARFPKPRMTDVWFLQRSAGENNQPQFGILPFKSAFWGPINEINFNPNQILFWANLRNDSSVLKALQNQLSAEEKPAAGQESSDFRGPSGQPPSQ